NLAVGTKPPTGAEVADQIPVQRRAVASARLRIRAAEGKVHGAGHLLIEQHKTGGAVDARVGPDSKLAETPRAGVGGERGTQVLLAAIGARGYDRTFTECELDARDLDAAWARGDREADRPVRRVLEWSGEHLAARHVVLAV